MNLPLSRPPSRPVSSLSLFRFTLASLALAPLAVLPPQVHANLPAGPQVVHGDVAIAQAGNAMTLTQASRHAIVNWQSFNVGAEHTLRLQQSGVDAAMLARVVGSDPSQLLGALQADGKLFLINPKGVLIGNGAVIDTAGFMASTLDVADRDFLAGGAMTFKSDSAAGIVNLGQITAREGNVMLFAHTVKNAGTISAPKGTAGLAAGTEVYLAKPDDASFVVTLNLNSTTEKIGVENSGVIEAAQAELKAAGGALYELAVNQSGFVRATGVETKNGRVILTADGGMVGVSGTVSARNADGSGGEILVGGDYQGKNASVPNATRTVVTAEAKLDASAASGAGKSGRAIVWADDATRFLGTLTANGNGGGFAEISGAKFLDFRPAAPVNLGAGGSLLLDPGDLTIANIANGTSTVGAPGGNPFVFQDNLAARTTLDVDLLQAQLASSDVTIDTSNSAGGIEVEAPITWTTNHTLRLNSGDGIYIYADITGGAGSTLALYAARNASRNRGEGTDIAAYAFLSFEKTIKVGTLVYGANAASNSPEHDVDLPHATGSGGFSGVLDVGTLTVDLSGGAAGLEANNPANKIGTFRTTGTGNLKSATVIDGDGGLNVELVSANSSANEIRIVTPGALTLLPATSLNFAMETDVILASTGGAFTNNATAGANVFGANGRYLIYSSSLAATTKGGLGGVNVFNYTYNPSEVFNDSTRRFFFTSAASLPILTYAANNASRIYGDANPALAFTVTGEESSHPIATSVSGSPSFTTTATQSSGVGTYAINIGVGTLFSTDYQFSFLPGQLTITRAPLFITANNVSRNLNHANPPLTASFIGLQNGDTSAVVTGLQLATTATTSSPTGTYPITASGGTAANYSISYFPGTLTIGSLAPLTITANNFSRTYGAANPTFTASYTGLVGADTASVVTGLQFSTMATQSSGVGSYAITPFGASATGYAISYVPGLLTIERALLTIAANHATRTYGDPNPAFSASFSGLVNGDTASVVSGLTFNAPGQSANAGIHAITPTGGSAANYALSYMPGTLNITRANLTVRADDKTRVYGDADPALTYSVTGLKNGDSAASVVDVINFASLASVTDPIGRYGILLQGFSKSPNYNATFLTGSLTVNPRPITIAADNQTKVYGDPFPTYTTTITGLPSFATPAAIPNVKASLLANVADGVQTVGIMPTSGTNPNYTITYKLGQLTITPATLELGALATGVRIYGRADDLPSLATVGGLKYNDTAASIGLGYEVPAPTADVGTYSYAYKLANSNYKLPDNLGRGVFYIEPAALDVQIGSTGRLYGDANPSLSLRAAGLAFGQTPESVLKLDLPDVAADVGVYTAVPSLTSPNYYLRSVAGGRLQINPRTISFEIDNVARYYGDANPVFTYTLGGDGFASFDRLDTIFRGFRTAIDVGPMTNVGAYRIDPIFEANSNYLVSWAPGFLAILPRPITLTINNAIAFGNDNAPSGFSTAGTAVDWVKNIATTAGGYHLTGFTATATNLPEGVSLGQVFPDLDYRTSFTNTPQPVVSAIALDQVFPAKPAPVAPQSTTAPLPEGWSAFRVVTLPSSAVSTQDVTATYDAVPLAVLDGTLIVNPTLAQKGRERFADQTFYISPTGLVNNNYAVTKITNGVLTMKADQNVVSATLAAEERLAKLNAARAAFLNPPSGTAIALGFSRDMIPVLRYGLISAIAQELRAGTAGQIGSLARLIHGATPGKLEDITDEQLVRFLADLHTNPEKQMVMVPVMMNYTMAIASKEPGQRTAEENKLLEKALPFIQQGQKDFVASAKRKHDSWRVANEDLRGNLAGAYGLQVVPYEKFIGEAVQESISNSMQRLQDQFLEKTAGLTEQQKAGYVGLTAGGVAGGVTGAVVATTVEGFISNLMPNASEHLSIASKRFNVAMNKAETATSKSDLVAHANDAIRSANKYAKTTVSMAKAVAGVTQIVSLAVEIAITQGVRVGEETEQKAKFDALTNPGAGPPNPHEMMKTETGRAQMMLGLMSMFTGGDLNPFL